MNHSQLHAIDLAIIGAYLIAMIVIGLVVVKKIKNTDDYYLGGRSFGPLVLMATVCATIIGGSGLMGRAGVAYSSGFKAIMTALPYLLGFAAGAMLYVVVEEMIPEMSQGRHSHIGVLAFAAGFSVMMVLDVALG